MGLVKNIWRKLTQTKALEQSSGRLETVFFESIYRIAYVTGKLFTGICGGFVVFDDLYL